MTETRGNDESKLAEFLFRNPSRWNEMDRER